MSEVHGNSQERPARILIVDDEPLNVDYLEQELDGMGFVTESAANGVEALERVAAAPPDLILLDVMMPGMDGITALRILKDDPETRLIPVVLMTALNAVEDRVRGIEAGADDFLSKPVDERELIARIRTALRQKRAIDQTVGELRSTSDHLERFGRQDREVAILAVSWRPRDDGVPEEAIAFLARSRRAAAEERIRALGGMLVEVEGGTLVAVFEGPDLFTRTSAAVEAALTVVDQGASASEPVRSSAAVGVGRAQVGSMRIAEASGSRWVYGAAGEPVDRALALAGDSADQGVLLTAEAAAAVGGRFALLPVGDGVFRAEAPAAAASALPQRRLRTILVTDIVDSTRTVERIGDRAWARLAAAHESVMREGLVVFGGQELSTTGDGFIALFDSPAAAVRSALMAAERLLELGLTIRAGVHTGELEQTEGESRGIAMHVAARISARAAPGEVLVSATTRELLAGAGLSFADRGEHTLKGVVEPRRLYAAREAGTGAAAGAPPPSPSVDYPDGLTSREVEVLKLVAIGLSDAEVAERLYLSVRTVNAHLRSVYRKLGVRSRAAAGRYAEENGLLETSA